MLKPHRGKTSSKTPENLLFVNLKTLVSLFTRTIRPLCFFLLSHSSSILKARVYALLLKWKQNLKRLDVKDLEKRPGVGRRTQVGVDESELICVVVPLAQKLPAHFRRILLRRRKCVHQPVRACARAKERRRFVVEDVVWHSKHTFVSKWYF